MSSYMKYVPDSQAIKNYLKRSEKGNQDEILKTKKNNPFRKQRTTGVAINSGGIKAASKKKQVIRKKKRVGVKYSISVKKNKKSKNSKIKKRPQWL